MRLAIRFYLAIYLVQVVAAFFLQGGLLRSQVTDYLVSSAFLFPPVFFPFAILRMVFRPRRKRLADGLEAPLLVWPSGDPFTIADLCRSIWIAGMIGSGKSSGSGLGLARAILACGAGMIIFGSKPEDLGWWTRRAAEAGRSADFKVFSPSSKLRCNVIDAEMKAGADTLGIVEFMTTMSQVLVRSKSSGESARFFEMSEASELQFAVEPIRQAEGGITPERIRKFIASAPRLPACLAMPEDGKAPPEYIAYRKGYHFDVMKRAHKKVRSAIEAHDLEQASLFWNTTYLNHDPKTRGNIEAGLLNTLDVYLWGVVYDRLARQTDIRAADLENGLIWFVDFSVSRHGASGKFINAALKFHVQKHCLRRVFKPGDRPIVLWADECQNILNTYDAIFIDECRSHGAGMVYLTQSLSNFYMAMGDKHAAEALVGEFNTLIVHAVDPVTAEYASRRVGSELQQTYGGSQQSPQDLVDQVAGFGVWSSSVSEGVRPLVEPRVFQTNMRTGGSRHGLVVDSYVIRSEAFSTGSNIIPVAWKQESA